MKFDERVTPPCPHAGVCGGCLWQHMAYEAQLNEKRSLINRAFEEAGHAERVDKVMPCPDPFYYRNRMDYCIGWRGEVGLKEYGSWNRYVDLSTCLLLDKETPTILQTVRELMRDLKLEPWDAKFHRGLVRYVVIRLGKNTGERMITLLVKDLSKIDDQARQEITRRLIPLCTTLYLGENPEITDLSLAKTLNLLHGNEFLTEEVNGLRYVIHPNSFFQTNTKMAGELQKIVLNFVIPAKAGIHPMDPRVSSNSPEDDKIKILDLYCGLGFFGIACAKRGMTVVGFELDAHAIELAKQNAKLNGVEQKTEWRAGAVEKLFDHNSPGPDAIILDPPRSGLHPRVIKTLLEKPPPTIVYVSCNYHRLVEELKQFKTSYRVDRLAALDLFPQTPHVEVVTRLVISNS
ncbi:MAG: 23S rRNA (uracil(1939)-C(5))-methyltransferase RlmD [Candidatus Uhrbacteria bacterium]|nr:23S rRNA (uracil(1939)-C(5))-methyltransferase RlmD [Candidatus Uhrbacteria bacterium]